MARTYTYPSTLPFVVDVHTLVRNQGRQIDWETIHAADADVHVIPAGTIVAELASGMVVPMAYVTTETATAILESGASDTDEAIGATTGYGCIVGGVIYSNLLPDAAEAFFDAALADLQAASAGFVFETYADDRA